MLLVAGGSGIVPLMAMIRLRAKVGDATPACLLYSSRTLDEVIYRAEPERLAARGGGLEVFHTLTGKRPAGWPGYGRRIDRELLSEVAQPAAEQPLVFVCGPTGLVETAASVLIELGHDPMRIRTERFGATGGT